ncbi:MAG: hypothetical protein IH989_05655 [Planctomycetes bacterium]|nr:hypothetical protein [Planctomycetota bacterium]
MFTRSERHTVSRILAVATMAAWLLLPGMGQTPAFGANEKGPRCSDGIDNDGDGLIDCDDPDCNCGGDDGGGDKANQPCVIFDDLLYDSVQSDDGTPYCDSKKAKVSVKIGRGGHLRLGTNSSAKAGQGRGLFVDFGTAVTLAPGTVNEMVIQTTDDALGNALVIAVSAGVHVGEKQDDFDFFNMPTGFEDNVNLAIRVLFSFTDGSSDSLLIRLAPTPGSDLDPGADRNCPSSDSVSVTDLGIDSATGLHTWTVVTQPVVSDACISRSGECEFGETDDTGQTCLLSDVDPDGPDFSLDPGHIALSFGFTVTAAP